MKNSINARFLVFFHISMHLLTFLIFLNLCSTCASAQFLVEVIKGHQTVMKCQATGANFGEDVMSFSFGPYAIGCASKTTPKMACSDVQPPLHNNSTCINNFALVPRGNCTFSEKAHYVQTYYKSLIMYNYKGQPPIPMSGSTFQHNISIPIVMINYACMESLVGHYSAENGYVVSLKAIPGYYDLIKYLVPFVVIVGFCFFVLFISLVIRLCKERRRLAKKRLSRSKLKKIPTKRYAKGDREETCAVCLEDFVDGDKLRLLPCNHAYHCKCIDPWLTKNRKVCPVCKRKVGPSNNDSSDSDSERASTSTLPPSRESEPLIRNEQPMATNSSAEFPYPPNSFTSLVNNQTNGHFSRAAALLNFSHFLRSSSNRSHLNALSRTESALNMPQQTESNGFFEASTNAERPSRLEHLYGRIAHNWRCLTGRGHDGTLPHSRLENEDSLIIPDELENGTIPHPIMENADYEVGLPNSENAISHAPNLEIVCDVIRNSCPR